MYAEAGSRAVYLRRERAARRRLVWQWSIVGVLALALLTLAISLGFAGSAKKLPEGVTIAGTDVGGLSTGEAVKRLERSRRRPRSSRRVPGGGASGPTR